jgi:replication factor C subunit 1
MFSPTSRETLNEKMELYFQDHAFVPLFIQVTSLFVLSFDILILRKQENYLKTQPARLRNTEGPVKALEHLRLMERASASISDGDLVDALIHGWESMLLAYS